MKESFIHIKRVAGDREERLVFPCFEEEEFLRVEKLAKISESDDVKRDGNNNNSPLALHKQALSDAIIFV